MKKLKKTQKSKQKRLLTQWSLSKLDFYAELSLMILRYYINNHIVDNNS